MARHEHRSFDHHHHNDCHHNPDRHHKHHQQRQPPHHHLPRARSLSPLNCRHKQQISSHNNHHRHNHHSHHLLDHHHRHQNRYERSRSSPVLRHRSSPTPLLRPQQELDDDRGRRGRYRKRSPGPTRHRQRNLEASYPQGRRSSVHRRHRSCGSLLSSERSISPIPRRRAASKGSLAHHLLRLLSSSATPNKGSRPYRSSHGIRRNESVYNSWSHRVPRRRNNKKESGATTDIEPLLLDSEDSVMPRRASHHISHLQRATRDDDAAAAAEADRLRKTREDGLEAERRRAAAAEEVAERSRRNRHQMELDEAELRRVRALEQFNEAERQRREMQIEGRLRQLEDQELAAQDPPKPPSKNKKCCRTFKIVFGILLSLGLVFVFYLIVASIMGQESPLDIFNFDISNDPLLVDIGIRDTGPNVTEPNNAQYPDIKKFGETLDKESANVSIPSSEEKEDEEYKFDNVVIHPFDTSKGSTPTDYESSYEFVENVIINPYDSSVGNSEIVLDYAEDRALHEDNSQNAYDTFGVQPPLTSINDRSILYVDSDQDLSPSNTRDFAYQPAFVASRGEDGYANLNFPQINNKRYLNRDRGVASSLPPTSYLPAPITIKKDKYLFEDLGESDDLTEPHVLPPVHISIPVEESFFDDQPIDRSSDVDGHKMHTSRSPNLYRNTDSYNRGSLIPTRRTGVSTDWQTQDRIRERPKKRQSLEKLEKQIIDTLMELSEDQNNRRRLRVGSRNPPSNTRRKAQTPGPRQLKPHPTTRSRNLGNTPHRRPPPMASRPRPYRPGPPNAGPVGGPVRGRNWPSPPYRRPYPMHHTRSPRTPHEDGYLNSENFRKNRNSKRGPRNSDYHVPPPEFRYPKSAGSIQDIIDHMTDGEGHSVQSSSRRESEMSSGYKVGDQDHILPPTFIRTESSHETSPGHGRRSIPRDNKRRQTSKGRSKTKSKHRFSEAEYDKSGVEITKYELFEPDDDVLFHSDGTITHLSDEHPVEFSPRPAQRERRPKVSMYDPPSSRDRQSSQKTYEPSVTSEKKRYYKTKPFKVMLDVYPVGEMQKDKYKPKYESRYTIQDEDGSYRDTSHPISREEFHSPKNRNVHSDEYLRYNSRKRHSSSDPSFEDTSREKYTDEPSRYSSREKYGSSDFRYRSGEHFTEPESRYSSREKYNSPKYRYSSRYYPKSRSQVSFHSHERQNDAERPYVSPAVTYIGEEPKVQSSKGSNQHTITLHINLYSKKPYADQDQRRMDVPAPREVSLDIPLTRHFTALDVYTALTQHVRRDSPYAQFLASNREGKTNTDANDVKLFDLEEGSALLTALEDALGDLNPALPSEVQFSLPSSAPQLSGVEGSEALASDRIKRMLDIPMEKDFDYTEGFSAITVNNESRNGVSSVEVNTETDASESFKQLETNSFTTEPVGTNSHSMETSSISNPPEMLSPNRFVIN